MEFVNLTRHTGIGSNCYWLSVGGKNIILDAGSDPKVDGINSTPDLRPLPLEQSMPLLSPMRIRITSAPCPS